MRVGFRREVDKALALRGSSNFPSLVRLYLTGKFLASVQHLHDNGIGVWPRLESLGIKAWDGNDKEFPATELQDLLSRRYEISCPVWQLLLPKADSLEGMTLILYLQLPITITELPETVSPFPDDSLESDTEIAKLIIAVSPVPDDSLESNTEITWSSSPSYTGRCSPEDSHNHFRSGEASMTSGRKYIALKLNYQQRFPMASQLSGSFQKPKTKSQIKASRGQRHRLKHPEQYNPRAKNPEQQDSSEHLSKTEFGNQSEI
ncbi:hypothetical protein FIBSPDRAFT_882533 [Athelia psychrophila]|uniref:Uncharacterized protein n=1 Tax=Athelia psychrophila TaxID=1759441 RepID=A0A166VH83_9AGAM|nr:hypothetical protein FIBSPDRAFT_882533 [Fibularhizoctonia sp. CBS 109695]